MITIGTIAKYLGEQLYTNSSHHPISLNKTIYSIHVFLNIFSSMALGYVVSLLLGFTYEYLLVFAAFMILRLFTGSAYHFANQYICLLFTVAILNALLFIPSFASFYWLDFVSILLILIFAPFSYKKHFTPRQSLCFKVISVCLVLINLLFIHSFLVSLTLLLQSLTLIPYKQKD